MVNQWVREGNIMNTKVVQPLYEGAHALYASPIDYIKDGFWMSRSLPPEPNLVVVEESEELLDTDYEWQFTMAEEMLRARGTEYVRDLIGHHLGD